MSIFLIKIALKKLANLKGSCIGPHIVLYYTTCIKYYKLVGVDTEKKLLESID